MKPSIPITALNLIHAFVLAMILSGSTAAQTLKLKESEQALEVHQGEQVVLVYNKVSPAVPEGIDPVYHRSGCLHPILTPNGRIVTDMFPKDHPHQHGIFTAWVKTKYDGRAVDFWNLAGGTGRVLHERVVSHEETEDRVSFEVDLLHRAVQEPQVDILRERWSITAYRTAGSYNCIDLDLKQTALTDKPLIVQKNRYGGFALRGRSEWLTRDDKYEGERESREPSSFLNDLGSDRIAGNHEHCKWVALTGVLDGEPATISVLSHPTNFRSPQAVRLHPSKPYFVYSPCVDGSFQIDQQHPYLARYRILITDAAPDSDWLDEQWETWSETEA